MGFECPSCRRPLYNRRRATCEFCGAEVPEGLLLTPEQRGSLGRLRESLPRRSSPSGPGGGGRFDAAGSLYDWGDFGGDGGGDGG